MTFPLNNTNDRITQANLYGEPATAAGTGDLKSDGTVPLTANWNVGNYRIDSRNSTGWYNVRAYGALGDGATNDTAAFQATADAANAAGPGNTIYVPASPNPYMITVAAAPGTTQTPGLKLYSNQRLTGDGRSSVLKAIAGTNGQQIYDLITNKNSAYGSLGAAPSVSDSKIVVDNVAFDGNKAAHVAPNANSYGTAHGIYFSRVKDCLIFNCYSYQPLADHFVYEYSTASAAIGNTGESAQKGMLYASGCEGITFADNVSLNDGNGIGIAASWYCTATGNTVLGWGSYGAAGGINLTGDARYNTISGNTVSGNTAGGSQGGIEILTRAVGQPTVHGITYGDASNAYGGSFNTIIGNTVTKNSCIGIYVTAGGGPTSYPANFPVSDYNLIEGNVVSENSSIGILNELAQGNRYIGNLVTNNGGTGVRLSSNGAAPARNSTGNIVAHNTIVDQLIQEPGSATKTHNAVTQTIAIEEFNAGGGVTDSNRYEQNTTTGTVTILGQSSTLVTVTGGNVAVGTTTPDLSSNYGVTNTLLTLKADDYPILVLANGNADADATEMGQIDFDSPVNTVKRLAVIRGDTDGTTATNRGGRLRIFTALDGGGGIVERLTINQLGYIGANTSAPTRRFDLNGDQRFRGMAAPAVSEPNSGVIYFDSALNKYRVSMNGAAYVDLVGSAGLTGSGVATKLAEWSGATSLNGAANIYADAVNHRLGVKVAAPAYPLDVDGDVNLTTGSVVRVNALPVLTTNAATDVTTVGGDNGASLGNASTAVGRSALNVGTGINDTAVGNDALLLTTTGQKITAVGQAAGATNTTGSNNVFLGAEADVAAGNLSNAVAIGYQASVAASNSMSLGNASMKVGVRTSTPNQALDVNGAAATRGGSIATLVNGANAGITLPDASYVRLSGPSAPYSIGGFSGGTDGRRLTIHNTVAFQLTIKNEDGGTGTVTDRIHTLTGADVVLRAGTSSASFIYDDTDDRWILVGSN